ncbi:hypothetical protein EJB05_34952, partial [Eragrostis curvula]
MEASSQAGAGGREEDGRCMLEKGEDTVTRRRRLGELRGGSAAATRIRGSVGLYGEEGEGRGALPLSTLPAGSPQSSPPRAGREAQEIQALYETSIQNMERR